MRKDYGRWAAGLAAATTWVMIVSACGWRSPRQIQRDQASVYRNQSAEGYPLVLTQCVIPRAIYITNTEPRPGVVRCL